MKKSSILVILGMVTALSVLAVVLLNRSDSEKLGLAEKNLVYHKIEEYRKEVVELLVPSSPKEKKQIIESKPLAVQQEISPRNEIEPVVEKDTIIKPPEKEKSVGPASKNGLKKISDQVVFGKKKDEGQKWKKRSLTQDVKETTPEKKQGTAKKEENPKEPIFWLYNSVDEDTLWGIAEKHYGKGSYYPVLLEHNPHVGIYDIGKGVTLNILKNRDAAAKIYKKIIMRKDGHFFWRYSVVRGDTLQSIIEKYYKKGRTRSDIPHLDKGSNLKPGEKIWILLE